MTILVTMTDSASISELKSRLSAYLDRVRDGAQVVVTDRGRPVAVLSAPAGALHDEGRTLALVRAGTLRPPTRSLPAQLSASPRRLADPAGRSLAALLEERHEER